MIDMDTRSCDMCAKPRAHCNGLGTSQLCEKGGRRKPFRMPEVDRTLRPCKGSMDRHRYDMDLGRCDRMDNMNTHQARSYCDDKLEKQINNGCDSTPEMTLLVEVGVSQNIAPQGSVFKHLGMIMKPRTVPGCLPQDQLHSGLSLTVTGTTHWPIFRDRRESSYSNLSRQAHQSTGRLCSLA